LDGLLNDGDGQTLPGAAAERHCRQAALQDFVIILLSSSTA
jgi:hypothetical protein